MKKNDIDGNREKWCRSRKRDSHTLPWFGVTGNHEGGKRMERCEGGWIARSKQAVKLPFKY